MKINIRNQFVIALVLVLVLVGLLGWISVSQASLLDNNSSILYDQNLLSMIHLADLGRLARSALPNGADPLVQAAHPHGERNESKNEQCFADVQGATPQRRSTSG